MGIGPCGPGGMVMKVYIKRGMIFMLALVFSFTSAAAFSSYEADAATSCAVKSVINYSSGMHVEWTKVSGMSKYYVYKKTGSSTTWKKVKTSTGSSWTDTNVSNGKMYTYKVYGYKSGKTVKNSTTIAKYRLKKPVIESLKSTSAGKLTVKTNTNSSATGYKIKYSLKSGMSPYKAKYVEGTSLSYTLSGLEQGKTYYVKVKSYKTVDGVKQYSGYSDKKKVTVKKDTVAVAASITEAPKPAPPASSVNEYQQAFVDEAMRIYNTKNTTYAHGTPGHLTSSGKMAFDCSGFASYVINNVLQKECPVFKLTSSCKFLPDVKVLFNNGFSQEQCSKIILKKGSKWNANAVQPGDLIFFDEKGVGYPTHVAMWLGDGKYIHCSSSAKGVAVAEWSSTRTKKFYCAVRYAPESIEKINKTMTTGTSVSIYSKMSATSSYKIKSLSKGTKVKVLWYNEVRGVSDGKLGSTPYAYIEYGSGKHAYVYKPFSGSSPKLK